MTTYLIRYQDAGRGFQDMCKTVFADIVMADTAVIAMKEFRENHPDALVVDVSILEG